MRTESNGSGNGRQPSRSQNCVPAQARPFRRRFASRIIAKCSRVLGRENGATLVEFAFASTVMLTLLFGTIEVGLAVYSYDFTSEAARDAVRYAIVRGANCHKEVATGSTFGCAATKDMIQTHVQNLGYPIINTSAITVTTQLYSVSGGPGATWTACGAENAYSDACAAPGNAIKVTVNYPFTMNVPFLNPFTINMGNSSMMVISN